jgi:hypothetical protein
MLPLRLRPAASFGRQRSQHRWTRALRLGVAVRAHKIRHACACAPPCNTVCHPPPARADAAAWRSRAARMVALSSKHVRLNDGGLSARARRSRAPGSCLSSRCPQRGLDVTILLWSLSARGPTSLSPTLQPACNGDHAGRTAVHALDARHTTHTDTVSSASASTRRELALAARFSLARWRPLLLCYAMLCYAMLCYAMPCHAMPCCAVLCCAVLCCAMLCCAML